MNETMRPVSRIAGMPSKSMTMRMFLAGAFLIVSCGEKVAPTLPEKIIGHCNYTNSFAKSAECVDYVGEWTEAQAQVNCRDQSGTLSLGSTCNIEARLGFCILVTNEKEKRFQRITLPGEDAKRCQGNERGCEFFGGGVFEPAAICGGLVTTGGQAGLATFIQPTQVCKAAIAGEPPGKGPDGKVCTYQMISGVTEPGRKFQDYADCNVVRTQRPYYPVPTALHAEATDARMNDPSYRAEVNWVKSQVESAACVCCHSKTAPNGFSNWYVEQPGNFINGFFDKGIAMGAGWINTASFGAYEPSQNNGFVRASPQNPTHSIFPTTDSARMIKFFENEAAQRGLVKKTFIGVEAAGPLDEQQRYVPMPCGDGEGISADGTISWRGAGARYVYVLEAGSKSPGVPPNLDLPTQTKWRIDVPSTGVPMVSKSVKYGVAPMGSIQRFPLDGTAPAALEKGKSYYLYVMADIALPNSRCLTTIP
jgi:hypothetical protein